MKTLKLLPLFLLLPLVFQAQKSLTGLWIGTLSNDSTTVRKDQAYEIALTQYKEKVYGYSRMTFIVNDTLYYIVKRIKGNIENNVCEVKDDEIIKHNFPRQPDKGVKLISTFRRNQQDSIWRLDGDWKTTETKRHRYYSISGKISLTSEPDYAKSKLFPHLEELNMDKDVEFYAAAKKKAAVSDTKTTTATQKEENRPKVDVVPKKETPKQDLAVNTNIQTAKKDIAIEGSKIVTKKQEQEIKAAAAGQTPEEAIASTSLKKSELPASKVSVQQKKNIDNDVQRPDVKKQELPVKINEPIVAADASGSKTELAKSGNASITRAEQEKKIIAPDISRPEIKTPSAAAFVAERKTVAPQVVEFESDSLELKLYDNGEIDGDTVSILLNGEIILAKQGLKAAAIKKTIHIAPGNNEVNLVLYAENLGKYPPNTGLLVVYDGEDIYQVRFSADLQQNAAVIFRRKK